MICRRHLLRIWSCLNNMKIISASFVKGAVNAAQFPATGIPEFAFFGRSNAGKSSLINMLLNRKNLVKTGSKPGMTREINFFAVNTPNGAASSGSGNGFFIADLPGYGYAQVSGVMRDRIDKMLYEYCRHRDVLRTLFFLMDIRRKPTEVERNSLEFFHSCGIKTQLVATKADKVGKNDQRKQLTAWADFFQCNKDEIIPTSSSKKLGRDKLLTCIVSQLSS